MRIEFSASIKGIVTLTVSAIMPHGVILHRVDHGANAESFYLLAPETHPGYPVKSFAAAPHAAALPLLFHRDGGFWHLDQLTGKETALAPAVSLDKLSRVPATRASPAIRIRNTGSSAPAPATSTARWRRTPCPPPDR
jgi:hypothetical protein